MMTSLLVFFANMVADILAVLWVIEVSERRALRSGLVSISIIGLSCLSIIYIVSNPWLVPVAMAGAFVGTYFTILFHKIFHEKND
jgi:fatty acid desaturase